MIKIIFKVDFLEPNLKETLELGTEPSVEDPRTDEMRTDIIASTLPTTGFDTQICHHF